MKTETTPKQAAIDALAQIRAQFRYLTTKSTPEWYGYKTCALEFCRYIEATSPESDLWTNGCTEAELGPESTIGDHLAVTRQCLGLLP